MVPFTKTSNNQSKFKYNAYIYIPSNPNTNEAWKDWCSFLQGIEVLCLSLITLKSLHSTHLDHLESHSDTSRRVNMIVLPSTVSLIPMHPKQIQVEKCFSFHCGEKNSRDADSKNHPGDDCSRCHCSVLDSECLSYTRCS